METEERFRNANVARWPQAVRFEWERVTTPDPDADVSFLDDPERYADEGPADRASYIAQDQARLAAYHAGEWEMVGTQAKVTVWVPIGGGSFTRYSLTSAGLWGTESDADEEHFASIFEEEKGELLRALKLMGEAAAAALMEAA